MNQYEYLKELRRCLSILDRVEEDRVIEYYAELIGDKVELGIPEEEVLSQLGTPRQLADKILAETQEDEDYTEKVFTVSDSEISSVKVDIDLMKVKVCYRQDDKNEIRITYYENNKHKPTVTTEDGQVTLKDKTDFFSNLFNTGMVNIKRGKLETIVEIPKNNKTLKINIETSNAKITANNLNADSLYLETSNADIDISGEFTDDVYCKTSNASINGENIKAHTVNFDTSNGSCNAETVVSHSLEFGTSNASINISSINSDSVRLDTSNNSINLGDTIANDSFYAQTSNGNINTKGIDSDKIELDTSNGSIIATIIGKEKDFRIESGTSNGNDNISGRGNSSASKSLLAYTSNGNINIDFDDEYTIAKGLQEMLD